MEREASTEQSPESVSHLTSTECMHYRMLMPSKISRAVTLRMPNEQLDLLDTIVEMGGFGSRSDAVRVLIAPTLDMCQTAMETKSLVQAGVVRLKAEKALMKYLRTMADASEGQMSFGDHPEVEVAPA